MRILNTLLPLLAIHAAALGGPIINITDFSDPTKFGTLDLGTGIFTQTGTTNAGELVNGPGGSVLGFDESGALFRVSSNGSTTPIGSPGLLGEPARLLDGTIYDTDLSNNLYTVNPITGATTLVGSTGFNGLPGGVFALILLAGQTNTLYAIATSYDLSTGDVINHARLFSINRNTGAATFLANVNDDAVTCGLFLNGTEYLFDGLSQVSTLNLVTGQTASLYDLSASLDGGILGVAAVPEPGTWAMMLLAGAVVVCLRRKRSCA